MSRHLSHSRGFTLMELVLVIVIIGILVSVAVRSGGQLYETAKIEETKQEMDALAIAIVGNADLENNGIRTDYGYVGDVGALPPNLDALYSNPGGYATWKGPYVSNRFTQVSDDYKKDAWGVAYTYAGNATITSTGSGSDIVRRLAPSIDDLLYNTVSGNILDADGTPPGRTYKDSLSVGLNVPNGSGGLTLRTSLIDQGGYFSVDSIPIGNHPLQIVYQTSNDTLTSLAAVTSASTGYREYRLASNVWYLTAVTGGGLVKVAGSDSLAADCRGLSFELTNTLGVAVDISSITASWSGFTAYYRYVRWSGATVVNQTNPQTGSGEVAVFNSAQTVMPGATLKVEIDSFRSNPTGGPPVDVDNTNFTITFSEGSSFDVTTGACP